MTQDEHPKNPVDAAREGLEQLERAPHHPTTERDKAPRSSEPPPAETPGEAHRSGTFPNLKK